MVRALGERWWDIVSLPAVGLAVRYRWASWRWRRASHVRAEAVVAVVWRECCLVGVALCRRGDDVAQVGQHIPVQRDAALEDYPELARALRGLLGGGCDARSWERKFGSRGLMNHLGRNC